MTKRRICYSCAVSLDGYIAGPVGEIDWIRMDPDIDFGKISERFDTHLVGRRTFEVLVDQGQSSSPDIRTFVFSRTLRQSDCKNVTVVGENWKEVVQSLREESREGHLAGSAAALFFVAWRGKDWSMQSKSQSFQGYSGAVSRSLPNRSRVSG